VLDGIRDNFAGQQHEVMQAPGRGGSGQLALNMKSRQRGRRSRAHKPEPPDGGGFARTFSALGIV
jgi:hypothetical protein